MKNATTILGLAVLLFASHSACAEWNFVIGGTYVSGLNDVVDVLEENLEDRGFSVDTLVIPIGVSFQGYNEMPSGLAFGFTFGPAVAAFGDIDYFDLPVGVDGRYFFQTSGDSRPYVAAGIRYHIAGGDDIDGSDIGPYGAVGMEFRREGDTGWGVELAYDGAEIDIENPRRSDGIESVKPGNVMLSVFLVF